MLFEPLNPTLSSEQRVTVDAANSALARLRAAQIRRVDASDYPGLASWAFDSYVQLALARIVSIGDGTAAEWNSQRMLNCIILGRALLESVAAWFRVLDETHRLLGGDNIRQIHSTLMVALFGGRDQDSESDLPKAINALTAIDRLNGAYPQTRRLYEIISEYVHPNRDGFWLFGTTDESIRKLQVREDHEHEQHTLNSALAGLHFLSLAANLVGKCETVFRGPLSALDQRFGADVKSWPGEWTQDWQKRG